MITRRDWLRLWAAATSTAAVGAQALTGSAQHAGADHTASHGMGPVGRVAPGDFNPGTFLREWNFSALPPADRRRYYRETRRGDGTLLREYEIQASERQIEVAPGVFFHAWTYNGQVPGPTLRATEGDRVRVIFTNDGAHPHSVHFHGWHPADMDGSLPEQAVAPGGQFVYEFDAEPAGVHLYTCHTAPFKRHLHKGLYGVFIVDSRNARPPADELVMVLNGFDTDADGKNDVYAVNSVAHHFMHEPIAVEVGRLVRMFVVNITEFDPI
ncbi:MAG TPA: multicopper oxidase domain-containing protein, partial [Vicinamibacterales bacterium]|nr:multicopper oxidase domain-containing protein [Vicinamibacterales bacterium]